MRGHAAPPPFVANDATGTRCLHACVQMVLKACKAQHVASFKDMDDILRLKEGKLCIPIALFPEIRRQGIDINFITSFSFSRFLEKKEEYLLEYCGPQAGPIQIQNTDMPVFLQDVEELLRLRSAALLSRTPTLNDIQGALKDGWYAMPLVNSKALYNKDGYRAHFILAYACDSTHVTFHDPGNSPRQAQTISWAAFDKSWMADNATSRTLTCFRPEQKTGDRPQEDQKIP